MALSQAIEPAAAATPDALTAVARIAAANPDNHERAVRCLTYAIAYEAGREPIEGQRAVAAVILNRTAHPAYPKSVCGVVFHGASRPTGCQFTFTCDGALRRPLPAAIMMTARAIAESALASEGPAQIGGATHYHANYVYPYWAPTLTRIGRIGAHIFYRAPGAARSAAHWNGGPEPDIRGLAGWLTASDALTARDRPDTGPSAIPAATAAPFAPWGLGLPAAESSAARISGPPAGTE